LLGSLGIHGGCTGEYVLDGRGALLELAADACERVDQAARIRLSERGPYGGPVAERDRFCVTAEGDVQHGGQDCPLGPE